MLLQQCKFLFTQGCSIQLEVVSKISVLGERQFMEAARCYLSCVVMKSNIYANLTPLLMCMIIIVLHGN